MAEAGLPAPLVPAVLQGCIVRRTLHFGGASSGVVTGARLTEAHGWLWRVHYAKVGRTEELTWSQLRECIVVVGGAGSCAPAAQPAASPCATQPAVPSESAPPWPAAVAAVRVPAKVARGNKAHTAVLLHNYKGVFVQGRRIRVFATVDGRTQHFGSYRCERKAAEAYDTAMRALNCRVVNFPQPGTDEVQAVFGETNADTLRRVAAAASAAAAASKSTLPMSVAEPPALLASSSAAAAAAAAPSHAAAAAVGVDAVEAFLRRITPPLKDLDVILAALPRSGFTLEHLLLLARTAMGSPLFLQLRAPTDQEGDGPV